MKINIVVQLVCIVIAGRGRLRITSSQNRLHFQLADKKMLSSHTLMFNIAYSNESFLSPFKVFSNLYIIG